MQPNRDLLLIYTAGFLRSLGIGLTGVLPRSLPLSRWFLGHTYRLGNRRRTGGASLRVLGGLGLALISGLPRILLLAFLSMLNGMGTDHGAAFASNKLWCLRLPAPTAALGLWLGTA